MTAVSCPKRALVEHAFRELRKLAEAGRTKIVKIRRSKLDDLTIVHADMADGRCAAAASVAFDRLKPV